MILKYLSAKITFFQQKNCIFLIELIIFLLWVVGGRAKYGVAIFGVGFWL